MLQIAIIIYGLYALITGKFSLGSGRQLEGGAARLLGAICVGELLLSLCIGFTLGILAGAGVIEMPETPFLFAIDLVLIAVTLVVVFTLGGRLYRQQELRERELEADEADASAGQPGYSVVDPTNPYASPTRER